MIVPCPNLPESQQHIVSDELNWPSGVMQRIVVFGQQIVGFLGFLTTGMRVSLDDTAQRTFAFGLRWYFHV